MWCCYWNNKFIWITISRPSQTHFTQMLQLHWEEITCKYLVVLALFKLNTVSFQYSFELLLVCFKLSVRQVWLQTFPSTTASYKQQGATSNPTPQNTVNRRRQLYACFAVLLKILSPLALKMLLKTVRPWLLRCGTQSLTCSRFYYADKVARIGSQTDKQSPEYQVC